MIRRAETLVMALVLAVLHCPAAQAQAAQHTILNVDVENVVNYFDDVSDVSTFATNPSVAAGSVAKNFQETLILGDIVSVNGQPVKGITVHHLRTINLRTAPTPGQAIADLMRANIASSSFEFLSEDGTPIGTIHCSGLGGLGAAPPGSPLAVTQGNNTIVGGTGAFLGARGQQGQAVTSQTVAIRQASRAEDPANRRRNGGGKTRFVLDIIPMSVPQIVATAAGPAVTHSSDFSLVTASKPATAGEILSLFITGLGPTRPGVDPGQPFPASPLQTVNSPVEVTVNGKPGAVTAAVGFPGAVDAYQVNVRVPPDAAKGAATIQVSAAWIAGPPVSIMIQ